MSRPGTAALDTQVAMRRARDLIDKRFAERIDIADMARAAGYSHYYFIRAFSAVYGETPGRYLTRRRVERAQELLRVANLTVTEVCYLVGFNSPGSFSSRFSEVAGVTPSEFQRQAHRTAPPPIPGCFIMMSMAPGAAPRQKPPAPKNAISEKAP